MSNMFDTRGVSGGQPQTSQYLRPGIHERVVIKHIEGDLNSTNMPYLRIHLYKEESGPERSTWFQLPYTEKATPKSKEKLVHLSTTVVTRAELDECAVEPNITPGMSAVEQTGAIRIAIQAYAANLTNLLSGKVIGRMKFTGEEYLNGQSTEPKIRTLIGLPRFAENTEVTKEMSRLEFDENNEFDFKRLKSTGVTEPFSL